MKSVYVHIPFCLAKCSYCDFSSRRANSEKEIEDYFVALQKEIQVRLKGDGASLYFGGGTPSIVPIEKISQSIETIQAAIQFPETIEITLEVNPATVNEIQLRHYLSAGVNRLSLGVQSTCDSHLKALGRSHTFHQAEEAYTWARQAGFKNISCDLIYGLPNQKLVEFQRDLEIIAAWQPEHISLYALSVEEATPLYDKIELGEILEPDEDLVADMFVMSRSFLEEQGYSQYELCSFSKKGYQCQHNLGYWQDQPYFGLGVSAHSFINGERFWNTRDIQDYIQMMENKADACQGQEKLGERERMAESILLRLRLTEGLKKQDYQGKSLFWESEFIPILKIFENQGLVSSNSESVWLTPKGMLLSDVVFRALL